MAHILAFPFIKKSKHQASNIFGKEKVEHLFLDLTYMQLNISIICFLVIFWYLIALYLKLSFKF
jgi:hypothetical protein